MILGNLCDKILYKRINGVVLVKPLIIITPSVNENEDEFKLSAKYFEAVRKAGGYALQSSYGDVESTIDIADGILFSGGGDIEPALSNDEPVKEKQGQISKARDSFEFELMKKAIERNIPVLGICRGMQVMGAVYGAHIIQHMEGHMQRLPKNETLHGISIKNDTLLEKITGSRNIRVNSFHHQAVGNGFSDIVSAVSDDGYIEAIELEKKDFVLGVQWHPEHLCETNENFKIFKAFVEAAGRYRKCQ